MLSVASIFDANNLEAVLPPGGELRLFHLLDFDPPGSNPLSLARLNSDECLFSYTLFFPPSYRALKATGENYHIITISIYLIYIIFFTNILFFSCSEVSFVKIQHC